MNDKTVRKGRLNRGVLALVFFGPLLVALWMYSTGQLNPASRSNHGALLEPVINIGDVLPESPVTGVADGRCPWSPSRLCRPATVVAMSETFAV